MNKDTIKKKKGKKKKKDVSIGDATSQGSAGSKSKGHSGKVKLQKLIEEEKKYGVDHYDDDIRETGNSHCL